ncbi:MAG TPA: hypothetical protein VLV50_16085 [Stellaceae bacterium]|nr:hypothetical protein [Stellaceae bacterium]
MTPAPAQAAPATPLDPAELLAIVRDLTVLLERETALVRGLKIAEIGPLQDDKTRLTQTLRRLLKQCENGANLPAAARLKWTTMGERLVAAATDNERALRVGRMATERLIGAVVRAVRESRRPHACYAPRKPATRDLGVSGVALDRRL